MPYDNIYSDYANTMTSLYAANTFFKSRGTFNLGQGITAGVYNTILGADVIRIVEGTGLGQSRIITSYNGTTKTANLSSNWDVIPDSTSKWSVGFIGTDEIGSEYGVFHLPSYDATSYDSGYKFKTGKRKFRVTNSRLDDENETVSFADADFVAQGYIDSVEDVSVAVKGASFQMPSITDTRNLTSYVTTDQLVGTSQIADLTPIVVDRTVYVQSPPSIVYVPADRPVEQPSPPVNPPPPAPAPASQSEPADDYIIFAWGGWGARPVTWEVGEDGYGYPRGWSGGAETILWKVIYIGSNYNGLYNQGEYNPGIANDPWYGPSYTRMLDPTRIKVGAILATPTGSTPSSYTGISVWKTQSTAWQGGETYDGAFYAGNDPVDGIGYNWYPVSWDIGPNPGAVGLPQALVVPGHTPLSIGVPASVCSIIPYNDWPDPYGPYVPYSPPPANENVWVWTPSCGDSG